MEKLGKYDLYGDVLEQINEIIEEKEACEKAEEQYEDGTTVTSFEGWSINIVKDSTDGKFKFTAGREVCIPDFFETRLDALIFMRDNIDYVTYWAGITTTLAIALKNRNEPEKE